MNLACTACEGEETKLTTDSPTIESPARLAPARRLNVLHVATINKPIDPANGYGPIESVIHNIDKGLTALGHRSIVACSADSNVTGKKFATVSQSLGDYCLERTPAIEAQVDLHLAHSLARARAGDIDIVHMHEWHDRVFDGSFSPGVPIVLTMHVPAQFSGIGPDELELPGDGRGPRSRLHAVAISHYQREQYSGALDIAHVVPHGVDVADYELVRPSQRGNYLFHIGRITDDKGQDLAIEVAKRSGMKLILAGYVQNKPEDRAYFERIRSSFDLAVDISAERAGPRYFDDVMKPLLEGPHQVIYVGQLAGQATKHWYGHAAATLFPIRWGEPFGMVLIESMASGTPVLAFEKGAVPEIVVHGETGYISNSVDSMVEDVKRIGRIAPEACRRRVETHFSSNLMASRYAEIYDRLAPVPVSLQLASRAPYQVERPARLAVGS